MSTALVNQPGLESKSAILDEKKMYDIDFQTSSFGDSPGDCLAKPA